MTEKRIPILAAYDAVIERVKALHRERHGTDIGALKWLAEQLGVSRQSLDVWGSRAGFPPRHVAKLAEITGLRPNQIRPKSVLVEFELRDWNDLPKWHRDRAIRRARPYSPRRTQPKKRKP